MTGTSWGDGCHSGASSTLGEGHGQEVAAGGLQAGDSEDLEPGQGVTTVGDKTTRWLLDVASGR